MIYKNGEFFQGSENDKIPLYISVDALRNLEGYRPFAQKEKNSQGTQLDQNLNMPIDWMTKSEVLHNFAQFQFPRLGMQKLIRMQAAMKGYYVRKYVYPIKKENNLLAYLLTAKIIREFLKVRSKGAHDFRSHNRDCP
jgi:hypothetical protein